MSEYAAENVEKLHAPPLVHDCTHPDPSDDDDGAEGAAVTVPGMPDDGDMLIFDATAPNKWHRIPRPTNLTADWVFYWFAGEAFPVWTRASTAVVASGYGNNYGNDYGGPP